MDANLIAPCGMNCALCLGFLREKNRCDGCRAEQNKPEYCKKCIITNCGERGEVDLCYSCDKYPCKRLKALDKRYRDKYHMSMLENLSTIRDEGMDAFLESQRQRWTCTNCGGTVCVHRARCLACGVDKQPAS